MQQYNITERKLMDWLNFGPLSNTISKWLRSVNIYLFCLLFRAQGGVEAEREERERWITRERQKIEASIDGK